MWPIPTCLCDIRRRRHDAFLESTGLGCLPIRPARHAETQSALQVCPDYSLARHPEIVFRGGAAQRDAGAAESLGEIG
jgi:hypothetical protein